MNVDRRAFLAFGHDAAATVLAWFVALWLRFNLETPPNYMIDAAAAALLWVVPLYCAAFWAFGLYRGLWRYASLNDMQRMLATVAVASLLVAAIVFMLRVPLIPRSVLILHPVLLILIMSGSRFAYRAWKERRLYGGLRLSGKPVLVLGAGEAGARLLRELARSREWRVMGLLDDDPAKHGKTLHGVPVLGPIAQIGDWAKRYEAGHTIVAMPSASAAERRRAVEQASACGVAVLTIPTLDDILGERVSISQVRQVQIEDLLGREPVVLDDAGLHRLLTGQAVMVTGAGGSIGAELARQVARYEPRLLILYEQSEYSLYLVEQEFSAQRPELDIACLVGDVRNAARLDEVLAAHRPQVIFHAAAYKHVPLMERDNAWEALQNNVLGTLCVARAALRHGIARFVNISTDKAVNPVNIMGASKRLSEMVCQSLQGEGATVFIMVRFGNVLGSSGSVIPKFKEQIARGGPVTVTHPDITRYFMSIQEAAQLVLQAGLMGRGGEIFVLDMGQPVKIADLARDLIRLSGFTEHDIRIAFTGLRPGEKLYEELLADGERTVDTPHPKLRIARSGEGYDQAWLDECVRWLQQPAAPAREEMMAALRRFVPEYRAQDESAGVRPAAAGRASVPY